MIFKWQSKKIKLTRPKESLQIKNKILISFYISLCKPDSGQDMIYMKLYLDTAEEIIINVFPQFPDNI